MHNNTAVTRTGTLLSFNARSIASIYSTVFSTRTENLDELMGKWYPNIQQNNFMEKHYCLCRQQKQGAKKHERKLSYLVSKKDSQTIKMNTLVQHFNHLVHISLTGNWKKKLKQNQRNLKKN